MAKGVVSVVEYPHFVHFVGLSHFIHESWMFLQEKQTPVAGIRIESNGQTLHVPAVVLAG